MSERTTRRPFLVEAVEYMGVLEKVGEEHIKDAFIGLWKSREDFGQHLLNDNDAAARIAALPLWLRPYVQLDTAAFVHDLERSGMYVLAEVKHGVCVFDGPIVHSAVK